MITALIGLSILVILRWQPRRAASGAKPSRRLVLILVLIQIRSGRSPLAALQGASEAMPSDKELSRAARVATVAGLGEAAEYSTGSMRPVLTHLARAQRSGGSLTGTITRMIEEGLEEERAAGLAKARALPTRLLLPVTLLMLPGLVVLLYAPALIGLFEELTGTWA